MNYKLYVKRVFDDFNKEINDIKSNKYYFSYNNVVSSIKDLNDKDFEKVAEIIINTIIKNIKNNSCLNKLEKYDDLWVEMQYRFIDLDTKNEIWEQADCVSDSIVKKLFGKNGRTIDLPIKIKYLKEYGIDYFINKEDIRIMLMYIVIQLLILEFILNNNITSINE